MLAPSGPEQPLIMTPVKEMIYPHNCFGAEGPGGQFPENLKPKCKFLPSSPRSPSSCPSYFPSDDPSVAPVPDPTCPNLGDRSPPHVCNWGERQHVLCDAGTCPFRGMYGLPVTAKVAQPTGMYPSFTISAKDWFLYVPYCL